MFCVQESGEEDADKTFVSKATQANTKMGDYYAFPLREKDQLLSKILEDPR